MLGGSLQAQQFQIDTSDLKILHILHLANGDRVSGRIVAETEKEVTLLNAAIGQVVVRKQDIRMREEVNIEAPQLAAPSARRQTNAPAAAAKTNTPPAVATVTNAAPSTNIVAKSSTNAPIGAAQKAPAKPPVAAKAPEKPKGPKRTNTDIQLGLNMRWGRRDSEDFFSTVRSTYNKDKLRHTADGSFAYGKTEEVLSANRLTLSSKLDYDIKKGWYAYNLIGGGYDEMRRLNYQYEVGPGMGYEVLTLTNFVWKTELGFTYQFQDRDRDADEKSYSARLGNIITWRIWDKLTADARIEIFPSLEEPGEFRTRSDATFRYPLWKNISLNLNGIHLYESDPPPNVPNSDLQIRSAIGIRF